MTEFQSESRTRSLLKGLTWRIIASTAIFIITYITTGEINTAAKVTSIEFPSKLALYYLHERMWLKVPQGSVRKLFSKN